MKNLNIGVKLGLLSIVLISILVLTVFISLSKLNGMNQRINTIVDISAEKIKLAARISQDVISMSRAEKNIITATTEQEMNKYAAAAKTFAKEINAKRKLLRNLVDDAGREKLDRFAASLDQYLGVKDQVITLAEQGAKKEAADLSSGRGRELMDKCEVLMADIVQINERNLETDKAASDENFAASRWALISSAAAGIALALTLSFWITRLITVPMRKGVAFAGVMAKGDFSATLDIDQKDEVGLLADALNEMSDNIRKMLADVGQGTETLSSSSAELSSISEEMSTGAEQTSEKSNTVATAAEEMSTNMDSISAAVEQTATSVNSVASATEEMTSTIEEIASNTNKTKEITENAANEANSAITQVKDLGKSVRSISQVTETIKEISEQTNLLALNATIEAARAGEAGKGFAVVAGEIKALAQQTSEATENISDTVKNIQDSAELTSKSIASVAEVVEDVNKSTITVASAIEEQTVTTREIAQNIAEASQGTREVTENVTQSAGVAGEIAADIADVNHSAQSMADTSGQVKISAEELNQLGEKLNAMMNRFTV